MYSSIQIMVTSGLHWFDQLMKKWSCFDTPFIADTNINIIPHILLFSRKLLDGLSKSDKASSDLNKILEFCS